jgi:hypothetical protein
MGWNDREQLILDALRAAEDERGEDLERVNTVVELTGLSRVQAVLGVRALWEAGYVDAVDAGGASATDGDNDFLAIRLLERGRRATGQWPADNAADALLDLLREHVDNAATDEERTRWQRVLDAAKGLGAKALEELAIGYLKHAAGI